MFKNETAARVVAEDEVVTGWRKRGEHEQRQQIARGGSAAGGNYGEER